MTFTTKMEEETLMASSKRVQPQAPKEGPGVTLVPQKPFINLN